MPGLPTSQRVYGGQVIGQSLVAAGKTVPSEYHVHSLHCYFIKAGKNFHFQLYRNLFNDLASLQETRTCRSFTTSIRFEMVVVSRLDSSKRFKTEKPSFRARCPFIR